MSSKADILPKHQATIDYSLTGPNGALAIEKGLAEADWYQCDVPRETLRGLLERRDGPAVRDTILWFALILASGYATYALWGRWWTAIPYLIYSAAYASSADSRWHECGHGTAFKSDWMNNTVYEIASFMMTRESIVSRWSHNRHHSDTIIIGRDPEIASPTPPSISFITMFFNLGDYAKYFSHILLHSIGRMDSEEQCYIPEVEFPKVYRRARIYLGIYVAVILLALYSHSLLPIFLVGLPNLFGAWLKGVWGYTQHAGLAEDVLDHRLNCRTVYMNPIIRFLYWNMNYHLEHHMFPLVPYHALPKLHAIIKDDCPPPYSSIYNAWCEILPAVLKQVKDPAYHVKRKLPFPKTRARARAICQSLTISDPQGWIDICASEHLGAADVIRFDHGKKTYALYRDSEGKLYATDGMCTHGNTHLAGGLVLGKTVECPKHNGRFNLIDGSPARAPICRGLATYAIEEHSGRIRLNIAQVGGAGAHAAQTYKFRVLSNQSVATFIKELVLEPLDPKESTAFSPGDYLQIDIPTYDALSFRDFNIPEPFASVWRTHHLFDYVARNSEPSKRNNYSLASNGKIERILRFNVRIATPPAGQDCAPGAGSSYIFSLRPGDIVSAIGPFGDFHIKPTQREMVYIGGGAGMAPLRAHISHLLETEKTARRISFWYGARSRQEIYYEDYFRRLSDEHRNFAFHLALSSPLKEDNWSGYVGFIHEIVFNQYLKQHTNPHSIEYYLCGPPMMIKACTKMLSEMGIAPIQIAYDEF